RAHCASRYNENQECESDEGRNRAYCKQPSDVVDDSQAEEAERPDCQFNDGEHENPMALKTISDRAACQRPDAEAEHENGNDDAYGIEVHPVPAKQHALPGNLIEQRGESRAKKQRARHARLQASINEVAAAELSACTCSGTGF